MSKIKQEKSTNDYNKSYAVKLPDVVKINPDKVKNGEVASHPPPKPVNPKK
jgi:hypothetical protein